MENIDFRVRKTKTTPPPHYIYRVALKWSGEYKTRTIRVGDNIHCVDVWRRRRPSIYFMIPKFWLNVGGQVWEMYMYICSYIQQCKEGRTGSIMYASSQINCLYFACRTWNR